MRWISVDDRLPKKGQKCLIIKRYKIPDTCPIIDIKTYYPGYKHLFNIQAFEVLYWYPIADCPKEVDAWYFCGLA